MPTVPPTEGPFYAHSGRDGTAYSDFQPLAEHLREVAGGARNRAAGVRLPGLADTAAAAGWLHDLGKYRDGFQAYIDPNRPTPAKADTYHKQAGAALAFREGNYPLAMVILGHHGGMPDGQEVRHLSDRAACPAGLPALDVIWESAASDCAELRTLPVAPPDVGKGLRADLYTRLLFSCLIDADWADTGRHARAVWGLPPEPTPPPLAPGERLGRVEAFIAGRARRPLQPQIKAARAEVLAACRTSAEKPPGLFSLTVPTGGGKTLAALAFALKHAAAHGSRRIIYVAPYMTILEQNADVIREALGVGPADPAVFEHYSLADPPADDPQETHPGAAARRAENWDAPVVVTTNVQFFESLFSNKPGRCRKLHNVARSVVILDECQTLPPGLVAPTCGMLKQLTTDLSCTVVLCTATQPAFDHDKLQLDERLMTEPIVKEPDKLFADLKRVELCWPRGNDERMTWGQVAAEMAGSGPACLCVVNTKKAARAVFDELRGRSVAGAFHLSTGMCPQQRREKLKGIRRRLQEKQSCYLVSTQLIEAGVDVDFPHLMREMAPLESVIQAAGRCNREGKLTDDKGNRIHGLVRVFRSEEGKMPPDRWYNAGRDKVEQIIAAMGHGPRIDDPIAIRDYFDRLYYAGDLDEQAIRRLRETFKFRSVAEAYRLIENAGEPVVVATWGSHRAEIAALLDELAIRPQRSVFRKLGPFQVNLLPSQRLKSDHLIHEGPAGVLMWDGKYDEDAGIVEELDDEFII